MLNSICSHLSVVSSYSYCRRWNNRKRRREFLFYFLLKITLHFSSRLAIVNLWSGSSSWVGVSFYDTVRQSRRPPFLSSPVIIVQPNLLPFYLFLLFPFLLLLRIQRTKKRIIKATGKADGWGGGAIDECFQQFTEPSDFFLVELCSRIIILLG